ncbi:protein of unknown function (plasmid) [Azospirillum baldaniorum]|uniref:RapA2 cadherin-like domain-containing protein n=1 Tax=Azospirillum baldaniorum TaxID=1064539 RepID=A0A9P1JY07_9PROT|nr:protein of unknown function [Azospirillum baldaniorum]
MLAGTDRVRFVPNADYNGSVVNGITFKAWDQTSGTAGTTVGNDTTANGGLGAGGQFSAASATADIAVTAVNDAPVLTDAALTLPSVAQAAGAPSGAVGAAVSSLVALGTNVSDVDSGAVTGIALVGVDTSEGGTWYYSTDGGTSWTAVGTVNDSGNALLLRTTDRLYYQPTGANAGILKRRDHLPCLGSDQRHRGDQGGDRGRRRDFRLLRRQRTPPASRSPRLSWGVPCPSRPRRTQATATRTTSPRRAASPSTAAAPTPTPTRRCGSTPTAHSWRRPRPTRRAPTASPTWMCPASPVRSTSPSVRSSPVWRAPTPLSGPSPSTARRQRSRSPR